MDTLSAFAMGSANRNNQMKVFDWDKAAQLIKEHQPVCASAGLAGDWEYTGGDIFRNGAPVPQDHTCTYLASTWATPQLDMDGEVIDCFVMESEKPDWNANTYWPDSAVEILVGET